MSTATINAFEGMGTSELPDNVIAAIDQLRNYIGHTSSTMATFVNHFSVSTAPTAPSKTGGGGNKSAQPRVFKKQQTQKDEWKRPAFNATVFAELDNTQTLLNDIRIDLNKISEANCNEKMKGFAENITEILEISDENKPLVFNMLFSVCSSNKIFAKVYANVLNELNKMFDFGSFFNESIGQYLQSMQNIVDIDSNADYDGFCELVAKNNQRKNITNFLCELAKHGGYPIASIREILDNMVEQVFVSVEHVEKQKEVEEITENVVIIFSHFGKDFAADFTPRFEKLAASSFKGITSRTKFKYMDLIGK
jgi:hypothetical protein